LSNYFDLLFTFIFAVLLHFCSCYVVQGTWYGVRDTHNFRGAPVAQPAPTKFGTKVVILTYSPNRSCVPNLKLLASVVAERSRLLSPDPHQFVFVLKVVSWLATAQAQVV